MEAHPVSNCVEINKNFVGFDIAGRILINRLSGVTTLLYFIEGIRGVIINKLKQLECFEFNLAKIRIHENSMPTYFAITSVIISLFVLIG
jgi:hypothetical protein